VTPSATLTLRRESEPDLYQVLREAGMGPRYPQLFHLRRERISTNEEASRPWRHKRLRKKPNLSTGSCSQGDLGAEAIELRRAVFLRDYGQCALCPRDAREMGWEADHILPTSMGGKNCLENLRTLCLACHRRETNRLIYGQSVRVGEEA
jgi:hypothetical protein